MATKLHEIIRGESLPGLDGLRAISVLIVIAYHSGFPLPARLGVSAFFVISGFLITWLLLREIEQTGGINLNAFYMRRVLRIFPAYYAFLAIALLADSILGDKRSLDAALPALFYVLNYYNAVNDHPSISIAHAWSLAIEEQFYLVWPAILMFMRGWTLRAVACALVIFIAAVFSWRCYVYFGTQLGTSWIYNAFDTRADNLAIGCLLAVVSVARSDSESLDKCLRNPVGPALVVVGLTVLVVFTTDAWRYTAGLTLEAVLLGVLVLQVVRVAETSVWSFLQHPAVKYIGRLSYGMYLYHVLALAVAGKVLSVGAVRNSITTFLLGTVFTVAAAAISYRWYESIFLRMKRRYRVVSEKPATLTEQGSPMRTGSLSAVKTLTP